ncbi:O-antigen ligase family protein [Gudongella sp. DL1XJH-153]|uniref:O-antigen ligase family protein n=1 Tax=Gudongella sp. DL1XJH-153 TaxID=3409804 RepID=UPI003BB79BAC
MDNKGQKFTIGETIYMLPYILVALSPILVSKRLLYVGPEARIVWNSDLVVDYFSYAKGQMIIIAALLSILIAFYRILKKEVKPRFETIHIFLGIYTLVIVLSHMLSNYPFTSLYGFPERYEGLLVHLSYLAIFISFPLVISKTRQVKTIVYAILFSALIIGVIGFSQFIGDDILKSEFLLEVIGSDISMIEEKSQNQIYSTFYNSNALGHYMAMLVPFALFSTYLADNRIKRSLLAVLTVLLFLNLLGSYSRGSLLGFLVSIIIYGCLGKRFLKLNYMNYILAFGVATVVFLSANAFVGGSMIDRYVSIVELGTNHKEDEEIDKIKSFSIRDDYITIRTTNQILHSELTNYPKFYDEFGKSLKYKINKPTGIIKIDYEGYVDFDIQQIDSFLKIGKGKSFLLFGRAEGEILFLNPKGEVLLDYNTRHDDYGIERIGSGRGYIWSRSLSLLKDKLFLGSGLDSFAYEFPQNDYKGKLNYMYDAYFVVDKTYNMYMQTAINSGIISLSAFISIIAIWLKKSKNIIDKNSKSIFIPIVPAIIAFLITGMFTDSSVSVTPTFWLLMAIGLFYHQNNSKSKTHF